MRQAYASMMPQWGDGGQSYPLMVWGEIADGNGGAFVHLVNTPELFGGEARIFASVEVRSGGIIRWVDYWDSRAFSDQQYAAMRPTNAPFPSDFGEHDLPSSAAPSIIAAAETLHSALAGGDSQKLAALLHPDVIFEDIALAAAKRGIAATVEHLTTAATAPFTNGAEIRCIESRFQKFN